MTMPATPRHVVILCHPETDSFNAAVAATYCQTVREAGQAADLRDLYRMQFDPVLRADEQRGAAGSTPSPQIAHERALIAAAQTIVLVYPIWLGSAPAMLKGYIERVFGSDRGLWQQHGHGALSHLAGKHLLMFTSSASSRAWLDEQGQWQSLINGFDRYLERAFALASANHVHFASVVEGLSERFFLQNMEDVRQAAGQAVRAIEHS